MVKASMLNCYHMESNNAQQKKSTNIGIIPATIIFLVFLLAPLFADSWAVFVYEPIGIVLGLGMIVVMHNIGHSISIDPDPRRRIQRLRSLRIVTTIFFVLLVLILGVLTYRAIHSLQISTKERNQQQVQFNETKDRATTYPNGVTDCNILNTPAISGDWKTCVHKVFLSSQQTALELNTCLTDNMVGASVYQENVSQRQFCMSEATSACQKIIDPQAHDECLWSIITNAADNRFSSLYIVKRDPAFAHSFCNQFSTSDFKALCNF